MYVTGDVGERLVVFAFDRAGKLQWQAANGEAWTGSFPGSRASCAYSEGKLYHLNAMAGWRVSTRPTGREQWAADVLERFEGRNITWAVSGSACWSTGRG